jgi:hypothetical protein
MIKAFFTGLWLMSFLAVRFPLRMLPIFLFGIRMEDSLAARSDCRSGLQGSARRD